VKGAGSFPQDSTTNPNALPLHSSHERKVQTTGIDAEGSIALEPLGERFAFHMSVQMMPNHVPYLDRSGRVALISLVRDLVHALCQVHGCCSLDPVGLQGRIWHVMSFGFLAEEER